MKPPLPAATLVFLALSAPWGVSAQAGPSVPPAAFGQPVRAGYADLVDRILAAPVIVDATIRSAARIKGAEAATVAPGFTRFYVAADVGALVRGTGGLPARIGYLVDMAPGADGRIVKMKDLRVLLFARRVAGSEDQLQLVGRDGQREWSPIRDSQVRGIVRELIAADAPPAITGIGSAFHVPGALPGEGETQIFLTTADNRPVSLSVLRRPGERPRWSVALSEIVDEAAAPPPPNTLLWYRLACALPATLPDRAAATLSTSDADAAREDYRFVIEGLGPCGRGG
ncbi:hypothetical protein [uncultured Sphingomonas sp.]|uniref:hypothetical protein n=1 Tax=uncultured Sphingomonas sp. TaxID=158754 RepID=UPI0035CAA862